MATILVRRPKNKIKKYRLWNTTVDQWETRAMDAAAMERFLIEDREHTKREARKRIARRGYPKHQIKWLKKFFDSMR